MRVASIVLAASLVVSAARAESAPSHDASVTCGYASSEHTSPAAGDVPANWPAFAIFLVASGGETIDIPSARLVRRSDGVAVPASVGATYRGLVLSPLEDLVVGETYDLLHPVCEHEPSETTEYRAVAPLPAATSLGTITLSPLLGTYRERGRENLVYQVGVVLVPDPSVEPWRDAYRWGTEVDGALQSSLNPLWATESGFAVDCNTGRWRGWGVPPGDVVVRGAAGAHEEHLALFTPELSGTYHCEDVIIVHQDTGVPMTPEEIAWWDRADMDGGPPGDLDGGVDIDGGSRGEDGARTVDGGRMGMHTEPDTDSSCSIAHDRGSRSPPLGLAVPLAIALLGIARWRRRA
jgi:hypothetical protein